MQLHVKFVLHQEQQLILNKLKKCYKKYKMIKYQRFHKLLNKIYRVLILMNKLKKYLFGKWDLHFVL
jgi:hypothetical protein